MRNILIPTDLTPCTRNTIKYAISLASRSKSKLYFYHASLDGAKGDSIQAEKMISTFFKDLNLTMDESLTIITIEDIPFSNNGIQNIIDKNDIDLVIMGSSPKGLGLTFFESHVSELIDEISCPVLSVPHNYNDFHVYRIGYATELYDLPERIKEIIPFARLFNANIEAFHVYPVFPQEVDLEEFNVKTALLKLSKDNRYDKINLHFIKTAHDNEPVTGIREFLRTYKPDMLVMCHKPRGLFDKLVLDTGATNALVKSSPIPILALNKKTACRIM